MMLIQRWTRTWADQSDYWMYTAPSHVHYVYLGRFVRKFANPLSVLAISVVAARRLQDLCGADGQRVLTVDGLTRLYA